MFWTTSKSKRKKPSTLVNSPMPSNRCLPPSALLVLLWSALVYTHYIHWRYFTISAYNEYNKKGHSSMSEITRICFIVGYIAIFMAFPFIGLLSDVCTGRHNTIRVGMYSCFISWIIIGLGYLFKHSIPLEVPVISSYVLEMAGYAAVHANIVQYNIDQLIGASATQLSTVIYWHAASVPTTFVFLQLGQCLLLHHDTTFLIISFIVSGLSITFVLSTHSLFQHSLERRPLFDNPVTLVGRVLCYARKHKYPANRSALTYWEEETPSRIDLGKDKYGGPFTIEQVENVKTVLRIIPLLIAAVGVGCADEVYWSIMTAGTSNDTCTSFISCAISKNMMKFLTTSVIMICFKLVPNKSLYKYTPSILKRIGIGIAIGLMSVISCAIVLQYKSTDTYLLVIPSVLFGVSYALAYTLSMEFTIAQCPVEMRGVLVGLWYASRGLGYAFNIALKFPFKCHNENLCNKPYYFVAKSGLVAVSLILFVIVARRYKYRVRDNDINIHKIADDYYHKYSTEEDREYDFSSSTIELNSVN